MSAPGRLAIVLHTHMPYVEGFGTWPFGEEWLWEAIATSYLPLLGVLDERPGRVTVSLTPVLCDQFAADGAIDRCLHFLRDVRPASHELDLRDEPDPLVRAELERSAARYAAAADSLERRGDLCAAFAPHATWTSSATHAVLPLLATDAGIRLQVRSGIAAHRARFGGWGGGFWLPECAHAPWLDPVLEEAGVHATCVDWTDLDVDVLRQYRSPAGPVLVPIDRSTIELVWSDRGYPSTAGYTDTHWLTERRHKAWAVGGGPYDPDRGAALVREHAADFVARVRERVAAGGLSVCALDTELLGHWWPEGVEWLATVLDEAEASGLDVVPLDRAIGDPIPLGFDPPATTWGTPRDLTTWTAPSAAGLAWRQRAAELRLVRGRPGTRALRELLALQSSDWAFLMTRELCGDYPMHRASGHEEGTRVEGDGPVRNLAEHLDAAAILEP